MNNQKLVFVIALSVILLSGCFGPTPEEQLYTIFEKAATQEQTLFEDVKRLELLEKQNQDQYAAILQEGKENNAPVKEKIEEALQGIKEREQILDKEHETLKQAYEQMNDIDTNISKLKDAALQKQAKHVQELYGNRYQEFQLMYDAYKQVLTAEKELYALLQDEEVNLKGINDKVKEVNELYSTTAAHNHAFNAYTSEYNTVKVAFYKAAQFVVEEAQ